MLFTAHTYERKYVGVVLSNGTGEGREWGVGRNERNPPTNPCS
jgi:hypothetical protein